jgi:mycofactocin precursor
VGLEQLQGDPFQLGAGGDGRAHPFTLALSATTLPDRPHEPGGAPVSDPKTDAEITPEEGSLVESELLVEDVSIDGMCGVY